MTIENEFKCFVAGLAAGVTAAALLAPKSGSRVRTYLRDKAMAGAEYLRHQDDELATTAASLDLYRQSNG
jgi:gas vesicle protein